MGNDLISFAQFYTCVVNLKKVVPRRRFYCFHHLFGKFVYHLCGVAVHVHDRLPLQAVVEVHSDVIILIPTYDWHFFAINYFHILNKFFHFFLIFVRHFHIVDMPHHMKLSFACPLVCDAGVVWVYDEPIFSQLF